MRSRNLITNGSVCEGDFNGTANTEAELETEHHADCRFFPHDCPVANSPQNGPYCIPRAALEIARYVIKDRTTAEQELRDFETMAPFPSKGFFDPTKEGIDAAVTDKAEIMQRMAVWTNHILGIQDIDSTTLHKEYAAPATDALIDTYEVLGSSVYDQSTSTWIHECGAMLVAADVIHQVRYKAFPLSGTGEVQHETVPYCATCEKAPDERGADYFVEDRDAADSAILKRIRDSLS